MSRFLQLWSSPLRILPGLLLGILLLPLMGGGPLAAQDGVDPAGGDATASQELFVVSVEVEGLARIDRDDLLAILGLELNQPLDLEAVDRGIKLVWSTYRARVSTYARGVETDGVQGLQVLVQVEELPGDLEPRFVGNRKFDSIEVRNAAGLGSSEAVYLDQIPRIIRRLTDAYRKEGYYFVEVRDVVRLGSVDPQSGALIAPDLIFEIQEGPRVRVRELSVAGNETLPDRRVALIFKRGLKRIADTQLGAPWFFGWFADDFVREELDADLLAMRQVYRDLGYLDAIVDLESLDFSRDRKWVTINVVVDEGPLYTVGAVTIEAVEATGTQDPNAEVFRPVDLAIEEAELLELIELSSGDAFESTTVRRDRGILQRRFGEDGYIAHSSLPSVDRWQWIDHEVVVDPDKPVVYVTYRLVQGRQTYVREIRIQGNLYTQDRVVRRRITVDEGELVDPNEVEASRRRIQQTGFFSDQRNVLEHREPDYFFVETDDPAWKDLVYRVEEGQVLTFNVSGGLSSNLGAFGIVSYSQRNFDISRLPRSPLTLISDVAERRAFHGAGQELRIEASPGTRISFFNILYREPDIFGLHRDRISMTVRASKRLRVYRSHDEERESYSLQFGRQVGPDSSVYFGYTVGSVNVDDIDGGGEPTSGDPLTVPRFLKDQEGESQLASLDFGYRMATVDNNRSPRNGMKFSWNNELQLEAVGSDYDYLKTQFSYNYYDEFGDEESLEIQDRWHFEFAGGVSTPFGDTENVPYSERFFLGGQSRMRGFRFRGVGPNQNNFPIGGETSLFTSFEYRRPLVTATQPGTYREIETLHWGAFADVGVLGAEDFDFETDEVRASIGLLFGLSVPLPISFSVGFPVKEGDGDREQRIGFSIGF
ncbi:MAG: outer membrane protein insertion porin family [Planctomycetota bacterium]|jgi:outer membrane protein insertion porin family